MLLITFCALLVIIFLVIKTVKNSEKIVFVNRFDSDLVKKVIYFFVAFFCVKVKIFVDFFLNKELVSLLIILLNIILKVNE